MQAILAELAAMVGGRLIGDGDLVISGAAPLDDVARGQITLLDETANRRHSLADCQASAAVVSRSTDPEQLPAIQVDDLHGAFSAIVRYFHPPRKRQPLGISPLAVVSPSARLQANVDVYPYATIGDDVFIGSGSTIHSGVHIMAGSKIGSDVTIFPGTVLYEDTIVGSRSIIHAGAVLGANGFGYSLVEGAYQLSAQLGNVILGADVEVGSGTTIDRGTYGPTTIGEGTKIDNQVMIAHNCRIGRHNMLCSQVGIAGSTTTGDYVVMAGQVGVRDHVAIGDRAVLGAMAGIINDVPAEIRMIGIPATPEREQKLKQAAFAKLPEMRRQLKKLQAVVDKLVKENSAGQPKDQAEQSEAKGRRSAA